MRSHTQGFLRSAAAGYDASACDRSTTSAAKLKVSFLCNRVIATSNTAMASSAEYNIVELYTNNCWLVKAVSQECFPLSFAPLLSKLSTKQQMVLDFGRFNKIMSRKHKYVKLDDFAATADNSLATGSKRRPRPCVVNCTSSTMAVRDWTRACLFFSLTLPVTMVYLVTINEVEGNGKDDKLQLEKFPSYTLHEKGITEYVKFQLLQSHTVIRVTE